MVSVVVNLFVTLFNKESTLYSHVPKVPGRVVKSRLATMLARRWNEAEELEVQVMEMRKRVLRKEHPNTSMTIGNLAFTLKSQAITRRPSYRWKHAFSCANRSLVVISRTQSCRLKH
jgi:hypothetical protein